MSLSPGWRPLTGSILTALVIAAAWGVGSRAEQSMTLTERVERKDWRVVRDMAGASPDAIAAIAQLTTSPDREVRVLAISCLDEVGGAVARTAMLNALDDREEDVRDRAVQAIEQHATKQDLPNILARLRTHADEFVRERLALDVGRIADSSAIRDLDEVLGLGQPAEVAAAIRLAKARLGDRESKESLLQRLESRETETLRGAIEDFVYMHDPTSAARLLPLLDDKRDALKAGPISSSYFLRVCDLAVDALGEILGSGTFSFQTGQYRRYSDEELEAAKRRLTNR